ncbi:hypothetical protein N9826_06100 [Flavobacteriaceae bacterium]|nr:hypothetical protein [Flavobacteriaceae bacterium]
MKLIEKNVFIGSDWFDLNFLGGFAISSEKIKEKLNLQSYKVDNGRLSSRVLNHWYKSGIINDNRSNGKGWKKFSISELVWVQIVFKLRKFGLDLNRIKLVKTHIDKYNSIDKTSNCLLLDFYILVAIYSETPIKLLVFESGQAEIVRQVDIDMANQIEFLLEDFIMIDLNKLLNKLLTKKKIKANYFGQTDTNNKSVLAQQIETSVSKENIQSVTIKVNDEDYTIGEKYFVKNKAKANVLMSMLNYGELIEKKNAGKSTYELTNKKKIKRDNP